MFGQDFCGDKCLMSNKVDFIWGLKIGYDDDEFNKTLVLISLTIKTFEDKLK